MDDSPSEQRPIKDIRLSVELAIEIERTGAAFYRNVAEIFAARNRTDIAATFGFLADSEGRHEERFCELLDHDAPTAPLALHELDTEEYLHVIALDLFNQSVYRRLDEIDDPIDVITRGIEMEKSSLLFYQGLLDSLGPHPALDAVIDEEKQHLVTLSKMLEDNLFCE